MKASDKLVFEKLAVLEVTMHNGKKDKEYEYYNSDLDVFLCKASKEDPEKLEYILKGEVKVPENVMVHIDAVIKLVRKRQDILLKNNNNASIYTEWMICSICDWIVDDIKGMGKK